MPASPWTISRRRLCGGILFAPLLVAAGGVVAGPVGPAADAGGPAYGALGVAGVRSRSEWKAVPARAGGRPHIAAHFAIHHTAGPVAASAEAPAVLRGIQAFHMKDHGWVDLAYHVFVDADGVAWEGRSPDIAGDTATTYDPAGWFLVCALGNFEVVEPRAAQVEGIAAVLAAVHRARGLPLDTLAAHRELAATLCPGKFLAAKVADGTLLDRARVLAE